MADSTVDASRRPARRPRPDRVIRRPEPTPRQQRRSVPRGRSRTDRPREPEFHEAESGEGDPGGRRTARSHRCHRVDGRAAGRGRRRWRVAHRHVRRCPYHRQRRLKWNEQALSAIRAYPPQTGPTVSARTIACAHRDVRRLGRVRPGGRGHHARTPRPCSRAAPAADQERGDQLRRLPGPCRPLPADRFPSNACQALRDAGRAARRARRRPGNTATRTRARRPAWATPRPTAVIAYRHGDGSNQLGGYANTPATPLCGQERLERRQRQVELAADVRAHRRRYRGRRHALPDGLLRAQLHDPEAAHPPMADHRAVRAKEGGDRLPAGVRAARAAEERRRHLLHRRHRPRADRQLEPVRRAEGEGGVLGGRAADGVPAGAHGPVRAGALANAG